MNGNVTIVGSGGIPPYSYTWAATNYTSSTISNLGAGNYTFTTTDANGCFFSSTVQLSQPAPINLTVIASDSVVCPGESITLTGIGADSYSWTNGITNGAFFFPLSTTVYTLTGTNTLTGCSSSIEYTVNVSDCTGISNKNLNTISPLSIFPNPNDGHFKIRTQTEMTLTLTNEFGQTIKECFFKAKNNYECSVPYLENGIYFLINVDYPFFKQKIVISR